MNANQNDGTSLPVVRTIDELRRAVAAAKQAGRQVAFVPTMGALHAGHMSLIKAAVEHRAFTVVSVYVNPTQFGPGEDLDAYPRTLDADANACIKAGAELIFAPSDAEMYPPGEQTRVRPGPLADTMCGLFRPGHFEGVCTIVAKLFNMVQPDVAYFGQKDAQQAIIIRRMVKDLCMPLDVQVMPIVREPDGLAMSSRNAYLSETERKRALCLHKSLCRGRDMLQTGGECIDDIAEEMRRAAFEAGDSPSDPLQIDYLVIVDAETLEPLKAPSNRVLLAGAIRIGKTRLIDNVLVDLTAVRA